MHFRQVNDQPTTFVVILEPGEEAMSTLTAFARGSSRSNSYPASLAIFSNARVSLGKQLWATSPYEVTIVWFR